MKNLFFKVSLFLFFILVTCIVIEVMIRSIPNDYKFKRKYLDHESDKIEILFLGASDAACGFNPAYALGSFNAAHPAQSLDLSFEILKKYENKWSKLKYIVLAVSYPSLFYKMQESNESWRVKNYNIYYSIPISNQLQSNAEILNGQLLDHFFRLFKYYVKNVDELNCSNLGWNISSTSQTPDSLELTGFEAEERHTISANQQCFGEMKAALDSIIDFSNRSKCKIILCSPPVYKSYNENLNHHQLDSTINTFVRIVKENPNCTYVNLMSDIRFKDDDFLDGDHLNGQGARKLTLIIDSIINIRD